MHGRNSASGAQLCDVTASGAQLCDVTASGDQLCDVGASGALYGWQNHVASARGDQQLCKAVAGCCRGCQPLMAQKEKELADRCALSAFSALVVTFSLASRFDGMYLNHLGTHRALRRRSNCHSKFGFAAVSTPGIVGLVIRVIYLCPWH